MKKYTTIIIALSLIAASCDDVLNITPPDRYSEQVVWGDKTALDKYVIGFYSIIKESSEIYNNALFSDAYTDLMKSSSWDQYNHSFNVVLLQETAFNSDGAGVFECWSDLYQRIKRYNEFLRDAPRYMSVHGEDYLNPRIAEVHFMRGFAYYRLIRIYGGVIIRTNVDGPAQNDKARASEAESWEQAMSDIQFAAENLPETWEQRGRISKAAAYGMLSRLALYAKDWNKAIEAAELCAQYGGALYTEGPNPYADIFNNAYNPELLIVSDFLPGYGQSGLSHRADTFFRPIGDRTTHNNANVYGAFGPTSELVDSYEVKTESGEWVNFNWNDFGTDPYSNRDPRFYATVLYNGARWEGRKIETYKGGLDGIIEFTTSGATGSTPTGYYFKKFITEDDTSWETKGSSKYGITLRYAEVLLNKAEALAEQDWATNQTAALEALNEVRSRVGLPDRTASSKAEFMEHLRHERIVELAGEGFRYWDLRRWRLAVDVINGSNAHGVLITKNEDDSFTYLQINVDADRSRIFYERYYAFSLPISERSNNKLLNSENNPGW